MELTRKLHAITRATNGHNIFPIVSSIMHLLLEHATFRIRSQLSHVHSVKNNKSNASMTSSVTNTVFNFDKKSAAMENKMVAKENIKSFISNAASRFVKYATSKTSEKEKCINR